MTFDNHLSRCLIGNIFGYLFMMGAVFAAPHVQFSSPMGEEKWRMIGNPLRCGLSIVIPEYGIGYFEQYATKSPHFILRNWDKVRRVVSAQVVARTPVWKPEGHVYLVAKTLIKPGAFGVFLSRDPTLKLLTYLSQGYQANINYRSEQGFDVTIGLSPIHFQTVYLRYQRCLDSLLPFNYEQVKDTVLHFGIDSYELAESDKTQLRRIAQYVEVDEQIQEVKVLGYADESGRKGYNNAISESRAEAVRDYFITLGVPEDKISINWFGALKPIARNDTDVGRAANRRVVINLIKR